MRLKTKLVLAQGPLALALALVAAVSGFVTHRLGEEATKILADNYRSVLAAQRMKEALESTNRAALVGLTGSLTSLEPHEVTFARELAVQEGNITEAGEREATLRLGHAWRGYREQLRRFEGLAGEGRVELYFQEVSPSFARVKAMADEILNINQDAMVRKSQHAERTAARFRNWMLAAIVFTALLALLASVTLTARLLRPVGVVAAAVRRFGGGDLKARARVETGDEIGQLAREFNTMAERLEKYRASSLGELIAAQQAAQAAIDGLPDPVVLMDGEGKVAGQNQAATTILAIAPDKPEPLVGVDPGIRSVLDRFRVHALGGRGAHVPRGFEEAIRISQPEGERIFLPRATPTYGETGEVSGVAVVFQDITRVFRSDELKNNLVATVAHEFRTPLTSLRMAIHLVLEEAVGPLTPKQTDLLAAGRDDCERLQSIVDDLLNLSRIESGRIDLHKRRTSSESLVSLALDVHRTAADDRQVSLRSEVYPGCPESFADPDRLQLVFTNLLSNALRYAPVGSEIVVSATPERGATDGHLAATAFIRFEVRDRGPGIAKEHHAGLFEKFFRVPGSDAGGSGLGLFIARGIVQAHGGTIGIDSEAGAGATFWFTIPAAPETAAPA